MDIVRHAFKAIDLQTIIDDEERKRRTLVALTCQNNMLVAVFRDWDDED